MRIAIISWQRPRSGVETSGQRVTQKRGRASKAVVDRMAFLPITCIVGSAIVLLTEALWFAWRKAFLSTWPFLLSLAPALQVWGGTPQRGLGRSPCHAGTGEALSLLTGPGTSALAERVSAARGGGIKPAGIHPRPLRPFNNRARQ